MINFKIYNSTKDLPDSWDVLLTHDIFLKSRFLKSLEESYPKNITAYYVGVFKSDKLVGIAIIQRVEMYIDNIFRKTSSNYFKRIAKNLISKIIKGNALVIGNLMHTGQHGLFFLSDNISQEDYLKTIQRAILQLTTSIKEIYNKKIRIVAFKDYFESDNIHHAEDFFKSNNLVKARVQPNMLFNVEDGWNNIDDYCSLLTKKYRRRFITAKKKGKFLEKKELSLINVKNLNKKLFSLYKSVSDNARVNSFVLAKNHFESLKQNLDNSFKVFGYFIDEELVGFYTLILNENCLETYFLGYNQNLQRQYQVYLNMLYDMLEFAIQNNYKTVIYARTAMEIKSSIGAKPYTMYIYVKHINNIIANTLLSLIVKYMNPVRKWEERHPYKN